MLGQLLPSDRPFPPGPRNWVPGSLLRAMRRDPVAFLTDVARTYGDVSHFRFGPQHLFLVNDPELVRDVLVVQHRSFQKGRALQRAKIFLGEGLLTSEGEHHRRERRLAQPAFHRDRINHYAEVMIEHGLRVRARWRDGQQVEINSEMARLTLAIVAKTLFDADLDGEAAEIGEALT